MKISYTFTTLSLLGLVYTKQETCWSESLGYKCCPSSNCIVYLTDENGDWGIDNKQWCGINPSVCNFNETCWSEKLGYKCCPSSKCTIYVSDASGDWGIDNNQWCGIDSSICNYDNINKNKSISLEPENQVQNSNDDEENIESKIVFTLKNDLNKEIEELNLSKEGYHFEGAFSDSDFTHYFDFSDIKVSQPYDLFIKYEKKEKYQKQNNINLIQYIDNLIEKTNSYIPYWNKEGFKGRWNYIDGVFLNSIVNIYKKTNDEKYKNFFLKFINYYISENGTFIYIDKDKNTKTENNSNGFKSGELDSVCESKILFDAYEMTGDSRYLTAIEYTYSQLMTMPIAKQSPNFSHKTIYPDQIWLDGMYMYTPFLTRYALLKNDPSIIDTIISQYKYIDEHMKAENGLYYHGYDTTQTVFWSQQNNGKSMNFWLRSLGWFSVSIIDILDYLPEGERKDYLKNMLDNLLTSILPYQDDITKMFYQIVDQQEKIIMVDNSYLKSNNSVKYGNIKTLVSNYVESSGTSMFAYTLMKYGNKYHQSTYTQKGKEIFEGIYQHSFKNNTLSDICITAGLGPATK
ncbi:Six-hairpin glycosidase, partial [Piromyces finnis]